jgi:hypothetical protein
MISNPIVAPKNRKWEELHKIIYPMVSIVILTKYFHKYLPPGYKVSPHSSSGAQIQQLWGEICSTITNFAACVVLVIGANNLPSNLQGLAVIFSHHQVCSKLYFDFFISINIIKSVETGIEYDKKLSKPLGI